MSAGDRIVAGKYRMAETLGKGGYSWVKKGTNVETQDTVALKFTAKGQNWDAKDEANFKTELGVLTKCTKVSHPNVMRIHEVNENVKYPGKNGQTVNTVLFVLEYAAGGELFDVLYYTGKLEQDLARTFFHQLVSGIESLHQNKIAHRDLKPQNLLLDGNMVLKITDFGLSKIFEGDQSIMTTQHVGTRGFQSPEQRVNAPYSYPTDIFAAGVILFILMTGYPPFEHAQATDYWYKELMERNGKPANTKKFWKKHRDAKLPEDLQDFINNLLAHDPAKRYTIDQIREHAWMQGKKLDQGEVRERLQQRLGQVIQGRANDVEKQREQYHSIVHRGAKEDDDPDRIAPDYKDCTFKGFTQWRTTRHPDAVMDALEMFMDRKGHVNIEKDEYQVQAMLTTKTQKLEFEANIYRDHDQDENVVVVRRLQGGFLEYGKFYNMILTQALMPLNLEV